MPTELSIHKDFDLSTFNTMGVSSKTSHFVEISSLSELEKAVQFAQEKTWRY